jgi:hypothetical protein
VHLNPLKAKINVLPTEQEMKPATNATEAHAQHFFVTEELLHLHTALAHCTLFRMLEVSCMCVYACMCVCVCVGGGTRTLPPQPTPL